MLPKVATHILHTTSRAAAGAVQNPLRNVLQTGSSTGTNLGPWNGPGSSNWGGHGPGTGSTKQNTGSRYHSSFNAAGRAVSQANAVSAYVDGTFAQSEENDEPAPRRVVIQTQSSTPSKRPRIRSSSVSLTKKESLGVLKTVQLHARLRFLHSAIEVTPSTALKSALLPPSPRPRRNSTSSSDGLDRASSPVGLKSVVTPLESGSQGEDELSLRSRRSSISSTDGLNFSPLRIPTTEDVLETLQSQPRNSTEGTTHSDVSFAETKPRPIENDAITALLTSNPSSPRFLALVEARESRNPHRVAEAVAHFRAHANGAGVEDFNLALEALYVTRHGESTIPMLETYNDMLKRSIQPDSRTYNLLILALTDRDLELAKTIKIFSSHNRRIGAFSAAEGISELNAQTFQDRVDILRSEQRDNFGSILTLFHAATASHMPRLPVVVYYQLLRSCAINLNARAALQVFKLAEESVKMNIASYHHMVQVHSATGDIGGAEKMFHHFIAAGKSDRLFFDESVSDVHALQIKVWNTMIEAYFRCGLPERAIGLLEDMMNSRAGLDFGLTDVPHPNANTYAVVLEGFCRAGDVQTAWMWYERLFEQGEEFVNVNAPSQQPLKPSAVAASIMIDALAQHGMIAEMNKVYAAYASAIPAFWRVNLVVYGANIASLQKLDDAGVKNVLSYLRRDVISSFLRVGDIDVANARVVAEYLNRGMLVDALATYLEFTDRTMQIIRTAKPDSQISTTAMNILQKSFVSFLQTFVEAGVRENALTFRTMLTLLQVGQMLSVEMPQEVRYLLLRCYAVDRAQNRLPLADLTFKDWENLLDLAVRAEKASVDGVSPAVETSAEGHSFGGVLSLLEDFATFNVEFDNISPGVISKTIRYLIPVYGPNHLIAVFQNLGPVFQRALEQSEEIRMLALEGKLRSPPQSKLRNERKQMLVGSYGNLVVKQAQSKYIEEALKHNGNRSQVLEAYSRLKQGLEQRQVPTPWLLGRLIQGLGRQGEVEKVKEVYTISQKVLKGMDLKQDALKDAWKCVEDGMIIALAHAGDVDSAHVHRTRILEQGSAPSADAYGALILYVKDTTDDASNAMMLYREAQIAGIEMNIYLYNNIISKLAKARKADHALELFHRMKAQGVRPTSITYGALIGACARVGDVQSAETLFAEMVEQKNFKPRVPPYNTMMQLYTMTKPNRERALYFYEQLGVAGVSPTAHTYKLLLDAYGSIEPVDIASMEAVFEQLMGDNTVAVQGTHYASLINAYGCVQRDLDKAISIFESVPTSNSSQVVDAVVFESIINVLVSHRRMDLVPDYISKMNAMGVHMTAYIANYLIKGYSIVGDLEQARSLFESLVDPPTGVAAPNNHAPHDPSVGTNVGYLEPVFREPSTWEAMVRAELGAGHRDRAMDLLQRLKARQYPDAVYNRISGVMVDHSAVV